jgi:hypothetical protein
MSGDNDRKMRELADRVVAMSPEPPPFPEENVVTQNNEPKPDRNPYLIFAAAAVVALLVVGIPFFLMRGGQDPVASSTTTLAPSTTVEPSPSTTEAAPTTTIPATTTVPETTTTAGPAFERRNVVIFLVGEPENSFTGNPAVVPFLSVSEALPEDSDEMAALRLLTRDDLILPNDFSNLIPAPVEVLGVERDPEDHRITIDMSQAFLDGAGGALADFTMLNQLIFSVTSEGGFTEVVFTVEGEPVTQFGSEGLDLSDPVGRDSFLDQLNSVIVDSAAAVTSGSPLVVTGFANVFEATVSLQLVDESGNVVHEDFTTATCGTGCWGAYSFNVDFDFEESTPITLRVFWNSAENGEPVDVVSMPVGVDGHAVWDMLPVES